MPSASSAAPAPGPRRAARATARGVAGLDRVDQVERHARDPTPRRSALDPADVLGDVLGELGERAGTSRGCRASGPRTRPCPDSMRRCSASSRAAARRQLEAQLGLLAEVARELARRSSSSASSGCSRRCSVTRRRRRRPSSRSRCGRAAALDLKRSGAGCRSRRARASERPARRPHTTTSCASPISRRKRGVDITPSSRASTSPPGAGRLDRRRARPDPAVLELGASSRSSASERANVSRRARGGVSSPGAARAPSRSSSSGRAPHEPARRPPSAAADTSSESPV